MTKKPFHEYQQSAPVIILVTAPNKDAVAFMPDFEAPSNFSDPIKIRRHVDEKAKKFLTKAALSALTGQVAGLITYMCTGDKELIRHWLNGAVLGVRAGKHEGTVVETHDGDRLIEVEHFGDERALLDKFGLYLPLAEGLIGHNLHGFILPFLIRRMLKHRIAIEDRYLPRPRYFNRDTCFDTMQAWGMGSKDQEFTSMKHLVQHLELDDLRTTPGGTMPLAFTESETFVERYAKDSVEALDDLARAAEITHLVASVLWGAFTTRFDFNRLLTINEARAEMDPPYPPLEGGDVL